MSSTRRSFLQTAAATGIVGFADLGFLNNLPLVSAADARPDPKIVRLDAEIEPLVRLLEETPREKLLEEVASRIKKGTTYREILAALLLAGVRNVEPRPSVGFKFHAVLVVNSAHLASLSSPDSERWLPIFWALDYFKNAQAQNITERKGWRMPPVDETKVPTARKARQAFVSAMEKWDPDAADAAIAGLARSAGADEVFELFWKIAPRDFRAIGHKIIFAANSRRTLDCIGWQYAEPVLRSLAYACQSDGGDMNPAQGDYAADRPGKRNRELLKKLPETWREGKVDSAATVDLLAAMRKANENEICDLVVQMISKGVSPQSIWDGLFAGSGELLMRKPGIVPLHALTTSNAMNYAYRVSADDETRRLLLLQNAAFVVLFRKEMERREKMEKLPEQPIDKLEAMDLTKNGTEAVGEIFTDVSKNRLAAARKTLTYLKDNAKPKDLIDAARVLVFRKGTDSHDYKFSSAVLEDYAHVSPEWRDRFLASSMFQLRGSGGADNALVKRTRAALGS